MKSEHMLAYVNAEKKKFELAADALQFFIEELIERFGTTSEMSEKKKLLDEIIEYAMVVKELAGNVTSAEEYAASHTEGEEA